MIDSVVMSRTFVIAALLLASCNPFGQYKCRSRQSEAKATLGQIKAAEATYFADKKKYTASTEELGITVSPRYYGIELSISGDGAGYKAIAKGDKPETQDDEWSVDQSGTITAVHDKCHE